MSPSVRLYWQSFYKTDGKWVSAATELFPPEIRAQLAAQDYHRGAIYTTAALLAEGMADLERWFQQGFAAVDMETATTFAVAEHFGMDRLAILYVFDNPRRREHLLLTEEDKDARRGAANAKMMRLAFDLAASLS
jgi:purine-nucleoside phosphorylase